MVKPKFKQSIEIFEKMLQDRELIIYGKSKESTIICDKYRVKYIVDRDDELCDATVGNVKIYSPDKLYSEEPDKVIVLICTADKYIREVTNTILGIDNFIIFYWNVLNNEFLNEISNELYDGYARIQNIVQRLYDDRSRKILREVVIRRMAGIKSGYDDLKIENELQYLFPPALFSKNDGAVLDCGGYIGDTIDRFINKLGNNLNKIYCFEALPQNISELEKKKNEISKKWNGRVVIVPFALADKRKRISFCETEKRGGGFSPDFRSTTKFKYAVPISTFEVEAVRIDDIIEKETVRYIKMDIEGAEYEALTGAKNTIIRERPALAISIYHNACDYYRIAELILSYVPEYKLAVRHHKARYVDSVLYAWI